MKDYRRLKLSSKNIDTYFPLNQKVALLEEVGAKYFSGDLLDVGCGEMPYKNLILESSRVKNYVGVDIENESYQRVLKPDLFWDGEKLPVADKCYNCSLLIEVLEHVQDPESVLSEVHRILKEGGYLLITVPFLWPLHDVPYDEYRYTPFALKRLMKEAGFKIIKMEGFGSWHASMASMIALYCRRALTGRKRSVASRLMKPLISYLHRKDEKLDKTNLNKGHMLTGIWCLGQVETK